MSVTFCPRIHWPKNDLLLPADLFGVQVPSGLSEFHVRAPNFVDIAGMQRLLTSSIARSSSLGLAITNGTVPRELEVHFADPIKQWRRLSVADKQPATHGPCQFQFLGGQPA